jgi:DNA polymerase-3 subunit alpha
MLGALDEAMKAGQSHQRDQASNQIDIFALLGAPGKAVRRSNDIYPQVDEWSPQESLAFEKEALGFYITGHPLDKYDRIIKRVISGSAAGLKEKPTPGEVKLAGVVSTLKLRNTKKGDRYASFNLEDKTGFLEVIVWPDNYRKCTELLAGDDPIYVKGRLDVGEDRIQVIANEITALSEAASRPRTSANGNGKRNLDGERLDLYLRESEISSGEMIILRDTLLNYPGSFTVFLHVVAPTNEETVIELPDQVKVACGPELTDTVAKLFGPRISFHSLES